MGIPGSGKKAISTRISKLMETKNLTEAEARQEISNQMRAIGSRGGRNGKGPAYQAGGEKAAGFAHPDHNPRKYGAFGGRISRRSKETV